MAGTTSLQPFEVRTVSRIDAQRYIDNAGAHYKAEYSVPGRLLFYEGRTKTWIMAEAAGGRVKLSLFKACPC